ncbi:LOW QUALITY PROTEIN: spindle assembly abnormal protein 6 homolog [Drosophila albomicans]|uniref:LOW QUALITY PROTEIN: spindle assembly abnormal protein 6 homolog n=1 Tax=Drosophila albomicans TaxID=7291 RepID=A0A6P8XVP1_DROAB|nr:LOW QUALITY PROTEIN: spindle assembly abnormal protein 6 homolog [Drosophila albomicans]
MWAPSNEETYFASMDATKNVVHIMPCVEMMVTFSGERGEALRLKKACVLYAERIDFKELIQLRLTEKCDQRRMYITTVDNASFHILKQDQSLNVTFAGFMENVIRMLKDCQAGKLELCLSQRNDAASGVDQSNQDYLLQFVEIRSFKNLVHLSLPCRVAPLNTVLFYINNMLEVAHKQSYKLEQNTQQLQMELQSQQAHIDQLSSDNAKLREALLENTRQLGEKHSTEMQQMHDKLQHLKEQHNNEAERSRRTIAGLQAQLDRAIQQKGDVKAAHEQAEQRNQSLNEELACCKTRISTLKEQNDKLHTELTAAKKQERKLEYKIEDLKQHTSELQEHIQKGHKEKANIAAELEAEKKINHTKRQALEMASNEISKANQIILKQGQEMLSQKKTIAWRTEVALQQEKAIKEKDKLLCLRENELEHERQTLQQLRQEIPQQLQSMRHFADGLEQKYTNQIESLKQHLTAARGKENQGHRSNRK